MADLGFGTISTVETLTLAGAQTTTAVESKGAEFGVAFMEFTASGTTITLFGVEASDDGGTTWFQLPGSQRATLTVNENWLVILPGRTPGGSTPRRFRLSTTSSGGTGTLAFKVGFNRRPVPSWVA